MSSRRTTFSASLDPQTTLQRTQPHHAGSRERLRPRHLVKLRLFRISATIPHHSQVSAGLRPTPHAFHTTMMYAFTLYMTQSTFLRLEPASSCICEAHGKPKPRPSQTGDEYIAAPRADLQRTTAPARERW